VTARFNLGEILRKSNRSEEAIEQFLRALNSKTRLSGETDEITALIHFSLASVLQAMKDVKGAASHFRSCIELDPNVYPGRVQFNLGLMLQQAGDQSGSREAFASAIQPLNSQLIKNPNDVQLQYALGVSYFMQNRFDDTANLMEKVIAAKPDDQAALNYLSNALIQARRYAEAIKLLETHHTPAHRWGTTRLAFLLAACPDDSQRDGHRALVIMSSLCPDVLGQHDNPDRLTCTPRELNTLAIALAETGQFEKAISVTQIALKIDQERSATQQASMRDRLLQRMQLYQAGKTFRMP